MRGAPLLLLQHNGGAVKQSSGGGQTESYTATHPHHSPSQTVRFAKTGIIKKS
jgi:hypothetical protein